MEKDVKTFYRLTERRRSVREFLKKDIEEEKVERLLETLRRAQSAANCQPWHFIVLGGEDAHRIDDLFYKEGFRHAPLKIVACAEPAGAWTRKADGVNYAWVDVAIAVTEMITAATAEGLATCWVASLDPAQVRRSLSIPDEVEIVGIIVIGYGRKKLEKIEKPRKDREDIIHEGEW